MPLKGDLISPRIQGEASNLQMTISRNSKCRTYAAYSGRECARERNPSLMSNEDTLIITNGNNWAFLFIRCLSLFQVKIIK